MGNIKKLETKNIKVKSVKKEPNANYKIAQYTYCTSISQNLHIKKIV